MGFYWDNPNNKMETCYPMFDDATKFSLPYREVYGSLPTQNALRKSDCPSPGKYRLSSRHFRPPLGLGLRGICWYLFSVYFYLFQKKVKRTFRLGISEPEWTEYYWKKNYGVKISRRNRMSTYKSKSKSFNSKSFEDWGMHAVNRAGYPCF